MDYISELFSGPGTFRFVIQPIFAVLLGARDGRNDAKSVTPPYLHRLLFKSGDRTDSLKVGLRAIALPLIIAVALDSILQVYIFDVWRLQWALIVGLCLVGIPYVLARGITNRIMSARREKAANQSRVAKAL